MLTWRLWRALRHPDEDHPLFQHFLRQQIAIPGARFLRRLQALPERLALIASTLRAFVLIFMLLMIAITVTGGRDSLVVLLVPLTLVLVANGYGALVAFNVMSTIKTERQQGTYDLLALTPTGLGASNWLMATAWTQRLNVVERLATMRTLITVLLVLLSFMLYQNGIFTPVLGLALMLVLNIDAIQTVISGCLSGMLAQELGENSSPFVALALFAFVQIILVYLPVMLISIALFLALHRAIASAWLAEIVFSLVILVLLFVLREVIIRLMWRELERRLL
jgi:hypothetical protein